MGIREVSIVHSTHYKFDRRVAAGPHMIRLQPSQNSHAQILDYRMEITPKSFHAREQVGVFGNAITRLVFLEKIDFLSIIVSFKARLMAFNPFDFFLELHAEHFPFKYEKTQEESLGMYLHIYDQSEVQNWLSQQSLPSNGKTLDFVIGINKLVFNQFDYLLRFEHGVQSPSETIINNSGSCRDFTWLCINIFRAKGIAARFVSGYLVDLNFDDESKDMLVFHAWVEVFLPGAGWVGLDPTSGLLVSEAYIPLCSVPHFKDAAPIIGNTEECKVEMSYESSVVRHF
ncbi:Transglutaminase-like enzyme, putative cysteine protease [Spirosomataceae bacterium TFI 002]|nr:Transglutaminase-like enzyme, putative cysteine protease [Spirosomataceae bacterium TFI 002]